MRTWTEEARKAQAEAIRRWQPWKQSTGPRSADGKARVSRNACKSGYTKARAREFSQILGHVRRQRQLARQLLELRRPDHAKNSAEQTIIITGLLAQAAFEYEAFKLRFADWWRRVHEETHACAEGQELKMVA